MPELTFTLTDARDSYLGEYTLQHAGSVVIATDSPDNRGRDIANVAAELATATAAWLRINPHGLIFIQHTPDQRAEMDAPDEADRVYPDDTYGEAYALVQFDFDAGALRRPRWTTISAAAALALLHGPAPASVRYLAFKVADVLGVIESETRKQTGEVPPDAYLTADQKTAAIQQALATHRWVFTVDGLAIFARPAPAGQE